MVICRSKQRQKFISAIKTLLVNTSVWKMCGYKTTRGNSTSLINKLYENIVDVAELSFDYPSRMMHKDECEGTP